MSHDSEIAELGRAVKAERQARSKRNLAAARENFPSAPIGQEWQQHSEYHWSTTLCGDRLDFWPSRNRFQWRGKVMNGRVAEFIVKQERHAP